MEELDYSYLSKLVERTQAGSSDAFAELYAATYKKQYNFAYKYLRDQYLAQDALQEVYILALKNLGRLKESKLFLSWLNQINFRVCFDMASKQKRNFVELDVPEFETNQVPHPEGSPEGRVSSDDEKQYILKKIKELPLNEAQAIMLKYYSEMKLEDIAKAMNCNRSSVKRYLQSGKNRLHGLLKDI